MQHAQTKLSFIHLPAGLFFVDPRSQGAKWTQTHYLANLWMNFNFLILLPPSTSAGIGVHQHDLYGDENQTQRLVNDRHYSTN